MKTQYVILVALLYVPFALYLALPLHGIPPQPENTRSSEEPGDTEDPLRYAYFTDQSRHEVTSYYEAEIMGNEYLSMPLPTYRLNYPPEEAFERIRDQTQSTFLEEVVQPMRESLYVNGFEPTEDKDKILREGKLWTQKITVHYITSTAASRVAVGTAAYIGLVGLLPITIPETKRFLINAFTAFSWIFR